jgi:sensor c-di-GMP phosphodiesterase-like protein
LLWDLENLRVLPVRRKLAAVAIGMVLAAVLALSFQYFVEYRIEQLGRQEVENNARRGIALASRRIGGAVAGLIELSRRGVTGCSAAERQALSATAFELVAVKELAVVGPDGAILCTNHGPPLGAQRVTSRSKVRSSADLLIEVVALGDGLGRMVRVRHLNDDGSALAALIPAELLLPQLALDGGYQRAHALMVMHDGARIAETGATPVDHEPASDRITAVHKSDDYGLAILSSLPRASLAARRQDMRMSAILAGVGASALIVPLLSFGWRRKRDNPLAELRRALQADEFMAYYQPILDISNGRLEGAEVLIRWRKPDGSIVPPAQFIPLLESSGLIFDVTRALMHRVCREVGPAIGRRARQKVSFNLTARHFSDQALVADIRNIFDGSPIALSQVVLEVTERQPLDNLTAARNVIAGLQELGVRVAIDDVGAGHGGLSYLLKLGVDIIKIDKLFVDAIGSERHSAAIISSLVELARTMRMDVVAEGVESFAQVDYLRDQGIRLAQGFVFAPPLPGPSFLRLLEAADPAMGAEAPAGARAADRLDLPAGAALA